MSNNEKVLIVSISLIGFGVYLFFKNKPEKAKAEENSTSIKSDWDKVLKKGSQGKEVGVLQKALKQLKVDEDFGEKTELRLKKVMGVTETSINDYNTFIKNKK